LISQVSNAFT